MRAVAVVSSVQVGVGTRVRTGVAVGSIGDGQLGGHPAVARGVTVRVGVAVGVGDRVGVWSGVGQAQTARQNVSDAAMTQMSNDHCCVQHSVSK